MLLAEDVAGARAAAAEWLRRVEAEYRSAALTANLCHWLLQIAVSPDLVREGMRIVEDELVHAEMAREVMARARWVAGEQAPPVAALARESLTYERRWEPLELDVTAACVETFCLGETVAVTLFHGLRQAATQPVAQAALDRILGDEVRHRDFGWLLLEALLLGREGALCRAFVSQMLPAMVERVAASYAALADEHELPAAARAWGMMPGSAYADALAHVATREYRPRLAALGFGDEVLACLGRLERARLL